MSGFWAMFWLIVVMKIPIAALFYIIWWATREPPVSDTDSGDGGGGNDRIAHPRIRPPRPPRRGPHAGRAPSPPSRTRVTKRRRRVSNR